MVLLIMLYKVVLTFTSVDETLVCDCYVKGLLGLPICRYTCCSMVQIKEVSCVSDACFR